MNSMTSNQPYLLRAIHQWILDNDLTPHLLVSVDTPDVEVPAQSVQNGQIVLNIAPHAISNMLMDNEAVSFSARFSGVAQSLYIPVHAIRAIYASENGEGMAFPEIDIIEADSIEADSIETDKDEPEIIDSTKEPTDEPPPEKNPPFLKIIK